MPFWVVTNITIPEANKIELHWEVCKDDYRTMLMRQKKYKIAFLLWCVLSVEAFLLSSDLLIVHFWWLFYRIQQRLGAIKNVFCCFLAGISVFTEE